MASKEKGGGMKELREILRELSCCNGQVDDNAVDRCLPLVKALMVKVIGDKKGCNLHDKLEAGINCTCRDRKIINQHIDRVTKRLDNA